MKRDVFSIIIPTFNSAATLPRCLRSIVNQTHSAIQIVIQDGGSTDNTTEIASRFANDHPEVAFQINTERDNGIYDAMNRAMKSATGRWLYFLGSDDELFDNSVLRRVACELANHKCDALYGDVHVVGNTNWASDGDIYGGAFDLPKLLRTNICHQSIFYDSHFIRSRIGNFNTVYEICADWDFNLKCFARGRLNYVPVVVARFHGGGASSQPTVNTLDSDFVKNVVAYFNLSLFDPLINTPEFPHYETVLQLQRLKHPIRVRLDILRKRILSRVSGLHWKT